MTISYLVFFIGSPGKENAVVLELSLIQNSTCLNDYDFSSCNYCIMILECG